MTSASDPTTTPEVAARIDAVADRIAADWGHHTHTALTTMITELYTDLAGLPPHRTPHQHTEILTEAADITTTELTTLLDDYLDHEADRPPVTDYGALLHAEDRQHAITAMLAALAADHITGWLIERTVDPSVNTPHEVANKLALPTATSANKCS